MEQNKNIEKEHKGETKTVNEDKYKPAGAKKKFLFVSHESLSGDLAWQIKKEGHEVKIHIESERDKEVYDGILDKVTDWKKHVDWADVVVFDDTGFGDVAESLRASGKLVIGGSKYTDKLEEDREFGQNEMKKVGMSVLPHWDFVNFDDAINFIKANPGEYVFKPSGSASDQKGILFLSQEEDGKDLIEILEQNKKLWAKKIKKFQLQKMAVGVEVAVGAFFNGEDFIYPINVNFEYKKLFPGDIGPYTGEMGTLMYWSHPNTIFNNTLQKMKGDLAKSSYVGYIDINCIANSKGIYPLEFTSRFGYPTISIQMEGVTSEWGDFLYGIAKKEKVELKTKKGFQVGVVAVVPPFPYKDKGESFIYSDLSILFKKPNLDGVHLGDVKLVNGGTWTIAGDSGYVLVITGSGITVEDARKQAYSRLKNIILQNMYYRTDIGLRWLPDSDRLQTWGYLY
jgi:phosphoribosylamine--glycine ligase